MEERSDGILLHPVGHGTPKLSREETARKMAAQPENWSEGDAALADGLEQISLRPGRTGPWPVPRK
jgi:hypothetical protein